MQAVVKFDTYELNDFYQLKQELSGFRVYPYIHEFPHTSEPFLYYGTPYTRIANPEATFNFLQHNKFDVMTTNYPGVQFGLERGDEVIGVGFSSEERFRDYSCGTRGATSGFRCKDAVSFVSSSEPVPILLVAHNRPIYLELTLNSLLFAMGDRRSDIHILMSGPTEEVRDVCQKFNDKHDDVFLYHSDTNVGFSGVNILNQIVNPDRFILWEDDYILPTSTKYSYPLWNIKMGERLEYLDLVSFATSKDNRFGPVRRLEHHLPDAWVSGKGMALIAASSAIKTKTYRDLVRKHKNKWLTATDTEMAALPRAVYTVCGYHIGANQEMDGFIANKFSSRFPVPDNDQEILCLATGERRAVKIDDILTMG